MGRAGKEGSREQPSFPASGIIRDQSAGTGRSVSKIDMSGQVRFSLLKSSAKQLRPAVDQRPASSTTVARVKLGKYCRSDSRTLLSTVCRRAPRTALFVRPVSRAIAGLRKTCSAGLLVPGTGLVSPRGVSMAGAVTCRNRRRLNEDGCFMPRRLASRQPGDHPHCVAGYYLAPRCAFAMAAFRQLSSCGCRQPSVGGIPGAVR